MTNQAILEKAVHKAIKNGWEPLNGKEYTVGEGWVRFLTDPQEENGYETLRAEEIIYDHRFAKALWEGTQLNSLAGTYVHDIPEWKYRLQEMVVSEDPIQYLGEHI